MARWRLLEPDTSVVSELTREAGVVPLCARVLANRGVEPGGAEDFLSPSLAAIGKPDEDVWGVAARRVAKAVEDGERIGVFGDYDTDGITSAAVLFLALSPCRPARPATASSNLTCATTSPRGWIF